MGNILLQYLLESEFRDNEAADVLEQYAMETLEGNDFDVLSKFIRMFPQFKADLLEFAAMRDESDLLPDAEATEAELKRNQSYAQSALESILEGRSTQVSEVGLFGLAGRRGIAPEEFAERVGISEWLIRQLENHRVSYSSIPTRVISSIAEILHISASSIAQHLQEPIPLSIRLSTFPKKRRQHARDLGVSFNIDQSMETAEKHPELFAEPELDSLEVSLLQDQIEQGVTNIRRMREVASKLLAELSELADRSEKDVGELYKYLDALRVRISEFSDQQQALEHELEWRRRQSRVSRYKQLSYKDLEEIDQKLSDEVKQRLFED